ncbi:MAG TPA: sigma factor-like helix-turn-helix DNA-binding protein [Candidatus Nanoarchaeia archaeon]|nr:sigma factor-like helix-turn-helix DNA-binding protein [Candidatus Nanoarchaeia archaeon]
MSNRGSNKGKVDDKKLIELRTMGLQYQEIAEYFGVSYVTIRKHIVNYNPKQVEVTPILP